MEEFKFSNFAHLFVIQKFYFFLQEITCLHNINFENSCIKTQNTNFMPKQFMQVKDPQFSVLQFQLKTSNYSNQSVDFNRISKTGVRNNIWSQIT